jgi:uncharacterized membrane protein YedE/YeeE
MHNFTPLASLLGGALIGLAASLLLLTHGKIAGISGIFGGLLQRSVADRSLRLWFIGGLLSAGVLVFAVRPEAFAAPPHVRLWVIALAGLLVGYGTRLGNGCTSGHGICGLSRLSMRSVVATLTFMATGGLTVFVVQHVLGGSR